MSDETPTLPPLRCIHLCCKSMLVYGEAFRDDPEFQDGQVEFWCTCTSRGDGPDNGQVSLELCSNPQRECYREFL